MVGSGTLFVKMLASELESTTPLATFHRQPHILAPAIVLHVPLTGTPTYAQKLLGGHPRCDLAPLTTSFGTVGQWERQHLAMTATCPEGEAWAASRNWNHGTHFLWDPRAAPTFHPPSTLRHRALCCTCQPPRSTLVLYSGRGRVRNCRNKARSTFHDRGCGGNGGVTYLALWVCVDARLGLH